MKTLLDWLHRCMQGLLTLLIGAMLIPALLQIVSRHTGWIPRYIWTEEAARFCFFWMVMVGAVVAVRDETHFDVDLFGESKDPKQRAVGKLLVHSLMGVLAIIFIWFGWEFAAFGYQQNSEIAEINLLSLFIAYPLVGIAWAVFLVEKLVDDIRLYGSSGQGAVLDSKETSNGIRHEHEVESSE